MANPFHQQVRFRKVTYTVLILALFTVSLLHRRFVVEPEAFNLQLREVARGEVELTSSAIRLTLTGSRGLAVTMLWATAIKKQEKHEWNEVELLVGSITKLQPYFITPWLFQSWNLAFNVAVECDRPRDKYYYISRGLELLAEGERRNQGSGDDLALGDTGKQRFPGNPDMRHYLGFTYHLKIGTSDEKNAMRCLLDLSTIDPLKRDPDKLMGAGEVKSKEFLEFCENHPRLVRRLREQLNCETPKMVVDFLAANHEVPSRFEKPRAGAKSSILRKDRGQQFPILPPQLKQEWPNPATEDLTQEAFDVYLVARTWFEYAQLPLPAPHADPGVTDPIYDPVHYRLPKQMATHIFRSYPARAQAYIAENLEAEGWFDADGWTIKKWFDRYRGPNEPEHAVGKLKKYHAGPAWAKAHSMYLDYGIKNGLYISPQKRQELEQEAKLFRDKFGIKPGEKGSLRPDLRSGDMGKSFRAHTKLAWNDHYRNMTNYDAHLYQSEAESQAETVFARKLFSLAERLRRPAPEEALTLYEEAWPWWLGVVLKYPRFGGVSSVEEDAYEIQLKYLRHAQRQRANVFKPVVIGLAQMATWPYLPLDDMLDQIDPNMKKDMFATVASRNVRGPLDWVLVYQGPEAESLRAVLLQWTTGATLGPTMIYPGQEQRILNFSALRGAPHAPQWKPLVSDEIIRLVRIRLGVDRFTIEAPKK